jgi:hypothetical protein
VIDDDVAEIEHEGDGGTVDGADADADADAGDADISDDDDDDDVSGALIECRDDEEDDDGLDLALPNADGEDDGSFATDDRDENSVPDADEKEDRNLPESVMVSAGPGLRSIRADVDCDDDDDAGEYGSHTALSLRNGSDVEVYQMDVDSMRVEGDSFSGSGNVSPAGATTPDYGLAVGVTAAARGLNDVASKLGADGDGGT